MVARKQSRPTDEAGRVAPLCPERRKEVDELWDEATPLDDVLKRRRTERKP